GVTCLAMKAYTASADSVLSKDEVAQFDLTGANPAQPNFSVGEIDLSWDMKIPDTRKFNTLLPNQVTDSSSWSTPAQPRPPVIEVAVSSYFPGQPSNIDSGISGTAILWPGCSTASPAAECGSMPT